MAGSVSHLGFVLTSGAEGPPGPPGSANLTGATLNSIIVGAGGIFATGSSTLSQSGDGNTLIAPNFRSTALTNSTVVVTDGSNNLISSGITVPELNALTGINQYPANPTIQSQINTINTEIGSLPTFGTLTPNDVVYVTAGSTVETNSGITFGTSPTSVTVNATDVTLEGIITLDGTASGTVGIYGTATPASSGAVDLWGNAGNNPGSVVILGGNSSTTPTTNNTLVLKAGNGAGGAITIGDAGLADVITINAATGPIVSTLTASEAVVTDSSKRLISYPYTTSSAASSLVSTDANKNVTANNLIESVTSTTASGVTAILTVSSTGTQVLVGGTNHTYQLPDATTLAVGQVYIFNDNSNGTLTITNNGGTTLYVLQQGSYAKLTCLSNGTSNGTWDVHANLPSVVTWGQNSLSYAPANDGSAFVLNNHAGTPNFTMATNGTATSSTFTAVGIIDAPTFSHAGNMSFDSTGSNTLNIGSAHATTINIGNSGSTTAFTGTVTGVAPTFSGLAANSVLVATSSSAISTTPTGTTNAYGYNGSTAGTVGTLNLEGNAYTSSTAASVTNLFGCNSTGGTGTINIYANTGTANSAGSGVVNISGLPNSNTALPSGQVNIWGGESSVSTQNTVNISGDNGTDTGGMVEIYGGSNFTQANNVLTIKGGTGANGGFLNLGGANDSIVLGNASGATVNCPSNINLTTTNTSVIGVGRANFYGYNGSTAGTAGRVDITANTYTSSTATSTLNITGAFSTGGNGDINIFGNVGTANSNGTGAVTIAGNAGSSGALPAGTVTIYGGISSTAANNVLNLFGGDGVPGEINIGNSTDAINIESGNQIFIITNANSQIELQSAYQGANAIIFNCNQTGTNAACEVITSSGTNASCSHLGVWTAVSDERCKENKSICDLGLNFIESVRTHSYNYITDQSKRRMHGVFANDLPNFSGTWKHEEKDRYSMDYTQFIAPLIKSVQELAEIVEKQGILLAEQGKEIKNLKKILAGKRGKTIKVGSDSDESFVDVDET